MDIFINELSLSGQFTSVNNFLENSLLQFLGVLRELKDNSLDVLKVYDLWERMVTPTENFHSVLRTKRNSDEIRMLKLAISMLEKEPFWESKKMQKESSEYILNELDLSGTSLAEACEREDKIVVSFHSSETSHHPLLITKDGVVVRVENLTKPGLLTEMLWENNRISFKSYLLARFPKKGRLDFTKVESSMGFDILAETDYATFIDTFRRFEKLSWEDIYIDKGLNYKEYKGKRISHNFPGKSYKFRTSRKYRCHGFRSDETFVVIGFEIDHQLSDNG